MGGSLTRLEHLLGSHEPLAATRIRGGFRNLFRSQQGAVSGFQISAPEGADAYANQFADTQTKAGKHLAYLALQPLLQHHAGAAGRESGDVFGLGLSFRDADTLEQLQQYAAVECLVKRDPVFLLDPAAGVGDVLGKNAVIGKDNQPFAVCIQPTGIVGITVLGRQ